MGAYTCFQYGGNSLVDYAIASSACFDWVEYMKVGELVGDLSDHAPIIIKVNSFYQESLDNDINTFTIDRVVFLWNSTSKVEYNKELCSTSTEIDMILMLETFKSSSPTKESVDQLTLDLTNLLVNAAKRTVPFKITKGRRINNKSRKNPNLGIIKNARTLEV